MADNDLPEHHHEIYKVNEKDLIPNGDYVSVVPNWPAPEGTEVLYLNGSDFRVYRMLLGEWRQVGGTFPTLVWNHIQTITVGASVNSVSFDSLDPSYNMFRMTGYVKSESGSTDHLVMRFNDDDAAHYSRETLKGEGSTASASTTLGSPASVIDLGEANNSILIPIHIFIQNDLASEYKAGDARLNSADERIVHTSFKWLNTSDLISKIGLSFQFGIGSSKIESKSKFILEGSTQ